MSEGMALTARLDHADRLVSADADFTMLNDRAGGAVGELLAVPQLATVVRLARRLRILVQRTVVIADADVDLECWVRAVPTADGVTLSVAPMRERPAWRSAVAATQLAPPPAGADWVWEIDAALRIAHLPVDAGTAHGLDPSALIGKPLTELFTLLPDAGGGMTLLEAMAAQRDFDGQAATIRGSAERVTLAGTARRNAMGVFAGFVGGVFLPVKKVEDAGPAPVEAFNTRLDGILRGPLGRIIANADSINAATDGPIDPHYVDYAADIASAGRHLMGLVDDLADLEAIERDDFRIEFETVDLADVLRRAAGLFAVRAADAGVTIDIGGADEPLAGIGEFRRILQILVNLIGNALRYSPRGGAVWLRVQRDGAQVVAIVADQGNGIAPEDQARIFAKFARVDPREPGGSGLGLYISRRLARAMGGDITVDSAAGEGARFVLTLPAA
ncbi:MAG: HAMP domain-containing sensor histidine kinase [Candidatus Sphingomonas colombiensis]|nr:HAMP domain-containing sensor histidine kinase [Sphingomonas sp.]WEK43025.1 MAG: HAMP domain-containing sensor histidine kinase [Sphingomonas sp.]